MVIELPGDPASPTYSAFRVGHPLGPYSFEPTMPRGDFSPFRRSTPCRLAGH